MLVLGLCLVGLSYASVPLHEGQFSTVDVLVVLGSPTLPNGYPSQEQRWRVDEAIREFKRGKAPYILMSGGAVANDYTEAEGMAEYAVSQGVPAGVLLEESRSKNTLENLRNSEGILHAHRWGRVEVISSAAHLHRAAALLEGAGMEWQTHAAPTPGWGWESHVHQDVEEVFGTALLRWCGVHAVPMLHRAKVAEVKVSVGVEVMASLLHWWQQ